MKIETLIVTMNQDNISKFNEMNLATDAIFANQTDKYGYTQDVINDYSVRMVSTNTKGVGLNRNTALNLSVGDICLLSDDDVVYNDGYDEVIQNAFGELPFADVIVFNIDTKGQDVGRRQNTSIKRVRRHNFMNYGAVRIAFRRENLLRKNIWFSHMFGGGAPYSSGEDTLFLSDALRNGLKVCTYPKSIGYVNQDNSTWFTGYNEKFFFDKGALIYNLFPSIRLLFYAVYYPLKFGRKSEISKSKITKLMMHGGRCYKNGVTYSEYKDI